MDLQTRTAAKSWQAGSYDKKSRSVSVVAATENPVPVYDMDLGRADEVLLMSGLKLPDNQQVPLCDNHDRGSVAQILGSARDFQTVGSSLECRVYFSDDTDGRSAENKVRDRHISDVSVGYIVSHSVFVPDGEKQFISGREFKGPVKVVTSWQLKELSLTVIGADQSAKIRSENYKKDENIMIEKQEVEKIKNEERGRVAEISAMCTRFECETIGQNLIENGASVDEARQTVMKFMERTKIDPALKEFSTEEQLRMEVGLTDTEKRTEAITDGLVIRGGTHLEKPAAGAEEFRGVSLIDTARHCLEMSGQRVKSGVSGDRIVRDAMSARAHTTSDFPYLLANVANKTLLEAYRTAPGTFDAWTNQTDGRDFKEMSRVQLGDGPGLDEIPEHAEYKYGTFSESREVFKIVTFGKLFAITRQAIVNDDLNAITRVPRAFSWSAKNGLNNAVYAALVGNSAMGDGKALFHADHSNYIASAAGAAPTIVTLTAARLAMRTQTGLDGATLNIGPRFLIIPAALETTADQILNTLEGYDIATGVGISNPFYKKLIPIVEPYLDGQNATGWYITADPAQIDTVEACYLGGQRVPYLETKNGWSVDGVEYKVRFDYGVKAIDYRGLYFNYGA